VLNLGILAYYKYFGFAVAQLQYLPDWFPKPDGEMAKIILPIGISFYVFQAMSYLVDVYRRETPVQRNPANFALYIAMFPQLIAGPIVRYILVADQINDRKLIPDADTFSRGVVRFCIGFVKKVVIADAMAVVVDAVYGIPGGEMSAPTAWLGVLAYTFQIYFDFSAYSDMAIGLGRMMGFEFPENFNRPYAADSVTDFWRRWHLTLSNWFRDYLYIPLGGSRGSEARTYANLWIVFMATGFWHGANWTFILWGAYHGAWLAIERYFGLREQKSGLAGLLRRASVFLIILLGWNLFRAESVTHAFGIYRSMFWGGFGDMPATVSDVASNYFFIIFALAVALTLASQIGSMRDRLMQPDRFGMVARGLMVAVAFPYALMLVLSGTFSAFIYYQF
jgi:alginate O-acetyltransferase complex protein AlgI